MIRNEIGRDFVYLNEKCIKVAEAVGDKVSLAYIGGAGESVPSVYVGNKLDGFVKCSKYSFNPSTIAFAILGARDTDVVIVIDGGNTYRFSDAESIAAIKGALKGLAIVMNDGRTYIINADYISKINEPYVVTKMFVRDTESGNQRGVDVDLRTMEDNPNNPALVSYVILKTGMELPAFVGKESRQVSDYCKANA